MSEIDAAYVQRLEAELAKSRDNATTLADLLERSEAKLLELHRALIRAQDAKPGAQCAACVCGRCL